MTADPFQPPKAPVGPGPSGHEIGRIDIRSAFQTGWELTKRAFFPWLGVTIVAGLLVMLSAMLLFIPVLIVGPAIIWGVMHYHLEVYEGRGEFGDVFSGFRELGPALSGFLLLFLCSFAISLPGQALSFVGAQSDSLVLVLITNLLSLAASIAVMLISLRWSFASWFIVEHRMNGVDAIRASWRATRGQWVTLFLLGLASCGVILIGMICLGIGVFPATAIVYFAFTAAYRQLVGPRAQPAAGQAA